MLTGIYFPLEEFEQVVASDDEILGVLYTGSLGRRVGDRYSDLDIEIWVSDEVYSTPQTKLQQIFTYLGKVHFCYPSTPSPGMTAFIGPDWQRVDMQLLCQNDLKPHAGYLDARLVKDTDSVLAQLIQTSPPSELETSLAQSTVVIEEAIDGQIYLALHNARGAIWSAMGEVSGQASKLYTLLARLQGYESFGFRYVETVLSDRERQLLQSVWPKHPDREEIRRAARALWTWTLYVWAEVEQKLACELPVILNKQEFLAAIDRIYSWE